MLALAGGVLYLFDPAHFVPFTGGLLVLGAWLIVFYKSHLAAQDETDENKTSLVVPLLNIHAYLLGAIALALPPWIAVATTVTAVLLLTGRSQLHALAQRIDLKEIVTAGQFLTLTGIVLPLLPNEPVTTLTSITPRQVWLALAICALQYWVIAKPGNRGVVQQHSQGVLRRVLRRRPRDCRECRDAGIARHCRRWLRTRSLYFRRLRRTAQRIV